MASTYSPNLRLELIGTGEQQGTWGSTTNTNLGTLLEEAIGGYVSVTVSDVADTTLTTNNGSVDQSRNMVINLTGALTGTRNVICPAIEKLYIVKNATTGGQSVVFKVSGQTGVTIPNGTIEFLYVDGTDARTITGSIASQDSNNVSITGGSLSNTSLSNVAVVANASSLGVRDSDGSHVLSIAAGSNLTANRVFTLTTGDAARTLDISAGNVTISTAGAALIDDADASAQRTTLGLGTIATQNANNVSVTGGSITGITDLALADGGTGASLSDPNANAILGWNDTANTMRFFTAGTGISINATSNTISATVTGGGNYIMQSYTNTTPGGVTWTKPAGLVAVRVTVVGGGGGGGRSVELGPAPAPTGTLNSTGGGGGGTSYAFIPAPSIPGPVTVTVGAGGAGGAAPGTPAAGSGGTSSFGAFASATGGGAATTSPGGIGLGPTGGAGSGGTVNLNGQRGGADGGSGTRDKQGGSSSMGFGGDSGYDSPTTPTRAGQGGVQYGGGGGAAIGPGSTTGQAGGAGAQGIVIVEEFY